MGLPSVKDRLKDTCDYFGWDFPSLSNFDLEKLGKIWHVEQVIEIKHVVKRVQKPMYIVEKPVELYKELLSACKTYGVTLEQVKGKSRKSEIIDARVHFCRSVKLQNHRVKSIQLAALLNRKDHTSILNYWYWSKANVPFPPLPCPKRTKRAA